MSIDTITTGHGSLFPKGANIVQCMFKKIVGGAYATITHCSQEFHYSDSIVP